MRKKASESGWTKYLHAVGSVKDTLLNLKGKIKDTYDVQSTDHSVQIGD